MNLPGHNARGGIAFPGHAGIVPPVPALHGVGLARPRLAVGKHRAVVALHHLADQRLHHSPEIIVSKVKNLNYLLWSYGHRE